MKKKKTDMGGSLFAIFKLVMFQGENYVIASLKRKIKLKWYVFHSVTTFSSSLIFQILLAVTKMILTLRLECSLPLIFGTKFSSQNWVFIS